jgi:hypothetical protein
MVKSSVKEKVVASEVGVKALVKTAWVVPLSIPPCLIVPLPPPPLRFPDACLQRLTADAECANEDKPMVNATNATVASVLNFGFITISFV